MKTNRNKAILFPYKNGFTFRKLNVRGECIKINDESWMCYFFKIHRLDIETVEEFKKQFDDVVIKCGMLRTVKMFRISEEAMMLMCCGIIAYQNHNFNPLEYYK